MGYTQTGNYLQGQPLEIAQSEVLLGSSKLYESKAIQCSSWEWIQSVPIRDHRRLRTVALLPMIKEQTSSEDELAESSVAKMAQNKTKRAEDPVIQISASGSSLLDIMHKKYCPEQYKKQQTAEILQETFSIPELEVNEMHSYGLSVCSTIQILSHSAVESASASHLKSGCHSPHSSQSFHPLTVSSDASPTPSPLSSLNSPPTSPFVEQTQVENDSYCSQCWNQCQSDAALISASKEDNTGDDCSVFDEAKNCCAFSETNRLMLNVAREFYLAQDRDSEVEAVEACQWLKEAGFPQYAQMYKDNLFPINLKAVERDHDFLDLDALQVLFRRLDTLNKCSSSKLKRSPAEKTVFESDDEEDCALSNKWQFQRNSRQWLRTDINVSNQPDISLHSTTLCSNGSSHNSTVEEPDDVAQSSSDLGMPHLSQTDTVESLLLLENPNIGANQSMEVSKTTAALKRPNLFLQPLLLNSHCKDLSPKYEESDPQNNNDDVFLVESNFPSAERSAVLSPPGRHQSDSENIYVSQFSPSPSMRRVASEKFRGAFSILRKVEGLKIRKASRKPSKGELTKMDIGCPVLIESPETVRKIDLLHCTNISPGTEKMLNDSEKSNSEESSDLEKSPNLEKLNIASSVIGSLAPNGTARSKLTTDDKQPSLDFVVSSQILDCNGLSTNEKTPYIVKERVGLQQGDLLLHECKKEEMCKSSSSLDAETKTLDKTTEIVTELLQGVQKRMFSSESHRPRISIYDNVCSTQKLTSVLENELDMILKELYENISSLDYSMSKMITDLRVDSPTSSVCTLDEDDVIKATEYGQSKKHELLKSCDSTDGNASSTPSEGSFDPVQVQSNPAVCLFIHENHLEFMNRNEVLASEGGEASREIPTIPSDPDSTASDEQRKADWSYPSRHGHERRDSGVGSSLTRTSSSSKRQKRPRLRWHSFAKSHQINLNSGDQPIGNLSAGQLSVLRKLSLLKVTATLEKFSPVNKANWSWFVPRLKRRTKTPNYSDRNVFGVPIAVMQQRLGQPLPQCILYAVRHLRRSASESIGIFRKSGVRSRVQTLREALESDPDSVTFDGLQAYDVADLLKLYFRELPECLLTNKLSRVFASIFLYVPVEVRSDLLRSALILLPDEHRLVLQSLLLFLSDMAEHSDTNQMNASNLAVCFAPSLFHLCSTRSGHASSPKQMQKRAAAPSEKELVEQKATHECLAYMITNAKRIFTVSEEMLNKCHLSYLEQGDPVSLEELCRKYGKCDGGDYSAYVDSCIQGVLKESREKFKGWILLATPSDVDLAYKKVGDGHPLRLWKFCVDVEAPPEEVLNRVLRERHLWDDDLLKWRIVEKLDSHTEVFQYVLNNMVPHPTRDFSELRSWRTDLPRGVCLLISTSVEHANAPLMGDVRGVILASRYLIEPCGSGKSRLTHVIRIDLRGHSPDWYNSIFGHICINHARRIRDSFNSGINLTTGPETKV